MYIVKPHFISVSKILMCVYEIQHNSLCKAKVNKIYKSKFKHYEHTKIMLTDWHSFCVSQIHPFYFRVCQM